MDGFQKIVLFAAIIILIVSLIFIGMSLSNAKDQQWPPITAQCPDYWAIDGSGNNSVCVNVKDLGRCKPHRNDDHLIMNFNGPTFTGTNGMCAKYTWATKCGVTWDGITYGVNNPCQTSTTS